MPAHVYTINWRHKPKRGAYLLWRAESERGVTNPVAGRLATLKQQAFAPKLPQSLYHAIVLVCKARCSPTALLAVMTA